MSTSGRAFLSPADIRRLLTAHGLAPSKRYGQNFVIDPNTVRKVVADAGVTAGDRVCEVGPGLGSLTLALRAAGADVVAIEIDAGMVRALSEVVGDDPGVQIVHGDALALDLAQTVQGPALLVANLPYNVATPIVMHALEADIFTRVLVMVQREVGRRWIAGPGSAEYSSVSVKIAARADARIVGPVSRRAFYPVPNVDSVTVEIVPCRRELGVDLTTLFGLVELGFGQRRKRLRNSLASAACRPDRIEAALVGAGLAEGARPEELALAQWVDLARRLDHRGAG